MLGNNTIILFHEVSVQRKQYNNNITCFRIKYSALNNKKKKIESNIKRNLNYGLRGRPKRRTTTTLYTCTATDALAFRSRVDPADADRPKPS